MQMEDFEMPARITNRMNAEGSNSDEDGNLFNEPSEKSEAPRQEGKLKKKKHFLMRCMNDNDSQRGEEEGEKEGKKLKKNKRLLFKKVKEEGEGKEGREEEGGEDSYSKNQSEIGSSEKLSDNNQSSQSLNDSDQQAMKLFDDHHFISDDLRSPKKSKKQTKGKQPREKGEKIKKVTKKELMKIKNQENWKQWEMMFKRESSDEEKEKDKQKGEPRQYFTGIEFQKEKAIISRKNKMLFNEGDLGENLDYQEEVEKQEFVLDLKPAETVPKSIHDFAFFKKVEKVLKTRHSDPPTTSHTLESFEKDDSAIKKAKASLNKLISTSNISQYTDEIQLTINLPVLVKGKSNHILNNTLFLKKLSSIQHPSDLHEDIPLIHSVSAQPPKPSKKKTYTRAQLFSSISKDIKLRKSKTISFEEIKESFKKTDLSQLDDIKKVNEKKRKDAQRLVDEDPNDSDFNMESEEERERREGEGEEEGNVIVDTDGKVLRLEGGGIETPVKQSKNYIRKFKEDGNVEEKNQEHQENREDEGQNVRMDDEGREDMMVEGGDELDYNEEIINDPIDEEEYQKLLRLDEDQDLEEDEQQEEEEQEVDDLDDLEDEDNEDLENSQQKAEEEELRPEGRFIVNSDSDSESIRQIPNQTQGDLAPTEHKPHIEKGFQVIEQMPEQQQLESKKIFNKLRKMAVVIAQKRKKREEGKKKAEKFFDAQAELGSDNEDNDFVRKEIDRKEEEEQENELGEDLDGELEDLIDNAVYLNDEDENFAFQKFMEDERLREKEELSRVIQGKFLIKNNQENRYEFDDDENIDREKRLNSMIEEMRRRDEEDDGLYVYNKLAEGRGRSRSQSGSEAEDFENPFQQELRKQLEKQKAKRTRMAEPFMLRKIRESKPEPKPEFLSSPDKNLLGSNEKKFKINLPFSTKRGSLMHGDSIPSDLIQRSQVSKLYTKDITFFTPSKISTLNLQKKDNKVTKPRKPKPTQSVGSAPSAVNKE